MSLTSLYALYITDNLFTALIWGLIEEMVIAWTQDLGRLKSMGLQRVRHHWAPIHTHTQRKWCNFVFQEVCCLWLIFTLFVKHWHKEQNFKCDIREPRKVLSDLGTLGSGFFISKPEVSPPSYLSWISGPQTVSPFECGFSGCSKQNTQCAS